MRDRASKVSTVVVAAAVSDDSDEEIEDISIRSIEMGVRKRFMAVELPVL